MLFRSSSSRPRGANVVVRNRPARTHEDQYIPNRDRFSESQETLENRTPHVTRPACSHEERRKTSSIPRGRWREHRGPPRPACSRPLLSPPPPPSHPARPCSAVCPPPPRGSARQPEREFVIVTGPRRSLSLKLSDRRVYEPQIRARLGTTAHLCKVNCWWIGGRFFRVWAMLDGIEVPPHHLQDLTTFKTSPPSREFCCREGDRTPSPTSGRLHAPPNPATTVCA